MPKRMKEAGIKYGHGGMKKPMPENYIGNPVGYFNDKAMYGNKERMAQMGNGEEMFDMSTGPTKKQMRQKERADRIFKKATEGSVAKRKAKAFKEGKDKKGQRLLNRANRMKERAYRLDDKAAGR